MLGRQQQSDATAVELDIVSKVKADLYINDIHIQDCSKAKFYEVVQVVQKDKEVADKGSECRYFLQTSDNIISCFAGQGQQLFTVELLTKAEKVQVLPESNLLVIGEKRGVLHFMNMTSGEMLHSQMICEQPCSADDSEDALLDGECDKTFVGISVSKTSRGRDWDMLIVMGSGLLVRLSFPIIKISTNDLCFLEELKTNLSMEMIESGIVDASAVACFTTISDTERNQSVCFNLKTLYQDVNVFILAEKKHGLSIWARDLVANEVTRKLCHLSQDLFHDKVMKMIPIPSKGVLFVLGSSSWVYLVDLFSFTMINRFHIPTLIDANLIDGAEGQSPKLMALFGNDSNEQYVQWLDLQTWIPLSNAVRFHGKTNILFSLQNGSSSILSLGRNFDEPSSNIHSVFSVQVLSLEESDILSVVSRLITEGKHKEALSFIQTKGKGDRNGLIAPAISMETYYKLCLQHHRHAVSIEDTLSHINDAKFLKSFAANYNVVEEREATPDLPSSMRVIDLVQHTLSSKEASETQREMIKELKKIHQRFVTFSLIDTRKRSFWGNDWHIFRTCNMQYSLQHAIASKDIGTALLLIKRHFQEESLFDSLEEIMREIPKSMDQDLLLGLLNELRGHCLAEYELREVIDLWVLAASEAIERSDRNLQKCLDILQWSLTEPQELSSDTPHHSLSPSSFISHLLLLSQEKRYKESKIHRLIRTRIHQLKDIMELDTLHSFKISFLYYQSTSAANIAMSMLDRVSVPELLGNCIQLHLKPFSAKHSVDLDQILVTYSKGVMESTQSTFSAWESRILRLIPQIKTRQLRISTLLDVMRRAPIPWSLELDSQIKITIENIIEVAAIDSGNKQSLLHQELLEQYKLMRLKRMLSERYGVKKFNVADITLAKRIVPFILKNLDQVDAVQDAILAMEVYNQVSLSQIIVIRSTHLMKEGEHQRLSNLLTHGAETISPESATVNLGEEDKKDALAQLSIWISERLDRMAKRRVNSSRFLSLLQSGTLLCQLSSDERGARVYGCCKELTLKLQKCFSPKMMLNQSLKENALLGAIQDGLDRSDLIRIGELFNFSQRFVVYKIATVYASSKQWKEVQSSCKELGESFFGPETADFIIELAALLIASLEESSQPSLDSLATLMDITQIALRNSDRSNIIKILSLARKVEILQQILFKTDLGAYQFSLCNTTSIESLSNSFKPKLTESGLVMSSEVLFPLMLPFLSHREGSDVGFAKKALEAAERCARDRNYQCSLRLVQLLSFDYSCYQGDARLPALLEECMKNIFENLILSESAADCKYALGFLLLLPMASSRGKAILDSCLSVCGKDFQRLQRIAKIGSAAGLFWDQSSLHSSYVDLIQFSRWMHEFKSLGIVFEPSVLRPVTKTVGGSASQRALVEELIRKSAGNVDYVLEYSRQYQIEDDVVFFESIKQLVTSGSDLSAPSLQSKIQQAINLVEAKDQFLTRLQGFVAAMSPYDYEGLCFLFNEMCNMFPSNSTELKKNILVLSILSDYARLEKPSKEELIKEEVTSSRAWDTHASKAYKRLPFHLLLRDPMKVLAAEISESTLPRLMPLAPLLNLEADQYYQAIIQRKVEILQKIRGKTIDFAFYAISFADFKLVILKITDFENALKITVYVAGAFPRGEDRIAAYRMALSINERWIASLTKLKDVKSVEKAKTGCIKIKAMLGIAQTEFSLQQNGLSELDEFVVNPNALLTRLLTLNPEFHVSASIIHEIATGVATRANIDLDKFKLVLLQKWLTKEEDNQSFIPVADRVIFLFHGKFEWGAKHLYSFSNLPATKISSTVRIKALTCLVRLALIPECSKLDFEKIQSHLQSALYLAEFEELGINQTLAQFDSCDKHSLARSLWVSHRNSVRGLRLICRLCIDYNIPDSILGGNVFTLLLQESKDLDFLLQVLERIAHSPMFSDLMQVWNEALKQSIVDWTTSTTARPLKNYINLLLRFPDVHVMKLAIEALETFLKTSGGLCQMKRLACAHALFMLNRQSVLSEWISGLTRLEDVLGVLSNLTSETATMNQFITTEIFDLVDKSHSYSHLLQTPYWSSFLAFLIENDRIDSLLKTSLQEGKVEEAIKLFRVYATATIHNFDEGAEEEEEKNAKIMSLLRGFIQDRQLGDELLPGV